MLFVFGIVGNLSAFLILDLLATAIDKVGYDVTTEPALILLLGEVLLHTPNIADDARVDIAACKEYLLLLFTRML